jgi:serine/threonine protein kinase
LPGQELSPGDVLGERFRIVKQLGVGGISIVYLAGDRQLGDVALKILRPELRDNPRAMGRFTSEVRIARSIRHSNICPVFDLFTFDLPCGPVSAATMEYVRGDTLAARLSHGAIFSGEAMQIASGIAAGIDTLHREGIVHRDLKPGNVILREAGGVVSPVIIDFGIASRAVRSPAERGRNTQAGEIAGSPDYMAPEQFRDSSVTQAADIYAFGLILFEMATGKRPFPAEDLLPAAIRRATEDAPHVCAIAPSVPRAWADPIARSLSRDPARRPASALAIIRDIQTESSAREIRSAPIDARRWHRRCRTSMGVPC